MNILKFMNPFRLNVYFFILFSLFTISSCTKTEVIDNNIKEPILIKTSPVEILDLKNLKFSGSVDKLNEETILDVGFIFYDRSSEAQNPVEISINKANVKVAEGAYSYIYSAPSNFLYNTPYAYCFFVKTSKALYKGEILDFTVDLIKVNNTAAIYGKIGEALILNGDFTQMDDKQFITATLENQKTITIPYELQADKKQLKLNLPSQDLFHGQQVDLILNYKSKNGLNHFSRKLINIEFIASIKEPSESQYYYNDILPITGLGIHTPHQEKLKIIINGIAIPYHSELRFSDFGNYTDRTFKWSVDYGNEVIEFKQPITFKSPSADNLQIENGMIHTAQIFSLKGLNFKSFYNDKLEVSLNDQPVNYTFINDEIINIQSNTFPHGEYTLKLKSSLYSITAKRKIIIKPLKVTGLSQSTVFVNDKIKILGDFIIGQNYHLRFSDMESTWLTATSSSTLEVQIPYLNEGKHVLILSWQKSNGEIIDLDTKPTIQVKEAEVNEIYPKSFNAGQKITVTGNGLFDIMGMFLDNYTIKTIQITQNSATFEVPYNFPPGKYTVSFTRKWRQDIKTNQIIEIK